MANGVIQTTATAPSGPLPADPYDGPAEATHASLSILLRLWPWLRPYRGYLIFMLVVATLAMVVQSVLPLITAALIDGPIARHETSGMYPLIGLALLFGVLEAVLFGIRRRAMNISSLAIETDLRRDFYQHLQRLPVSFHDRWPSGQLLSRVTSDLSMLRRFVGFMAVFLVANLAVIVVVLAMLIRLHPVLGLAVCVVMLPLAVATRDYERRYNIEARHAQDLTGDLATGVEESVLGIRVIKSFGRRGQLLRNFTGDASRLREAELAKNRTLATLWTIIGTYPQLVLAGVTCFGVLAVAHGSLSRGDLVAFITLQLRLNWPLMAMGWLIAGTEETVAATARLFEVFDTDQRHHRPGRSRSACRRGEQAGPAAVRPTSASGSRARPRTPCTAAPRHRAGRDDGAGRRHRLGQDHADLAGLPAARRHRRRGPDRRRRRWTGCAWGAAPDRQHRVRGGHPVLGQRPGEPQPGPARGHRAEIAEAIEIAQAGFVHDLPYGLDTRVGEQGLSLSGGQRQRLALARAVLGRPRVLVLDDPLSALDVHTEAQVERALRRVLGATTALVVAHRASTVLLADRVALLTAAGSPRSAPTAS